MVHLCLGDVGCKSQSAGRAGQVIKAIILINRGWGVGAHVCFSINNQKTVHIRNLHHQFLTKSSQNEYLDEITYENYSTRLVVGLLFSSFLPLA